MRCVGEEYLVKREEFSSGKGNVRAGEKAATGEGKAKVMPPMSVMTRLIRINGGTRGS
ncbi:hypothetical protein LINPERHAP1_LOCUS533 [Linum perenne]